MRVSSVRISTRSLRSRFVSGSSMRNARGRRTSARARATRCISPPDICAGRRCSRRSMCSRLGDLLDGSGDLARRTAGGPAAARRCSRTPCVAGRGRSSGRPWPGRVRPGCHAVASLPSRCTDPASSFSRPAIARRVVVLPAPDGPSTTKNDAVRHVERHPVQGLHLAEGLAQPLRCHGSHQATSSSVLVS